MEGEIKMPFQLSPGVNVSEIDLSQFVQPESLNSGGMVGIFNWGPGYENESQYLRVFIAQLRKKIENDPNRPKHIQTESGVGYRFQ